MKKRLLAIIVSVAVICTVGLPTAFAAESVTVIDTTYNAVSDQPIVIGDNVTTKLTLNNVTINAVKSSAITLGENSNVIIELIGVNTLAADSTVESCGIFVPTSAKLTIEGKGTLNVTGGLFGAGIGTYGHLNDHGIANGDITINSGIINTKGGEKGAGIGSGNHTDAGNITINGGEIKSVAGGWASGIGSGYGTSGGADERKVGSIYGGHITINGGIVKAAAFDVDFDKVDVYNPSTFIPYDYASCSAGIGGGYGANGGDISITGGTVTAFGSCGGAGIGAGRGTSKAGRTDVNAYVCNISISGNAKVLAFATDDSRSGGVAYKGKSSGGGAAIGSGRGTISGGNITIKDNANVTAIASPFSSAIGTASNKNPETGAIPETDNITISGNVKLFAVSDGTRYAIDTSLGKKNFPNITSNIQQILFDKAVLNSNDETDFDLAIDGKTEKSIVVPNGMKSVAVNVNKEGTYYLKSDKLFGVQNTEAVEYATKGSLAEQSCIKLIEYTEPVVKKPEANLNAIDKTANDYAYIFGKTNTVMAPDDKISRGEACAVLYRMLKQIDELDGFTFDKNAHPLYSDLSGRWDRSAIEYMSNIGVYDQSKSTIYPDQYISRSEAFKLFCLAMKLTKDTTLNTEDYADMLYNAKIIIGDENGDLHLSNNITRAEYCTIYNKITGREKMVLVDKDGNKITPETYGFTDFSENDWFCDTILRATSAYTDGYVDINKRAQRNVLDDYE